MPEFTSSCRTARALSSRQLDCELSEMELSLLRRHLERCSECAGFSHGIAAITATMRAAPLEQFTPAWIPGPRGVGRSRQWVARVAASTLVAAAALGVMASLSPLDGRQPAPSFDGVSDTVPVEPGSARRRGVPIVMHTVLPLGQLNAAGDF